MCTCTKERDTGRNGDRKRQKEIKTNTRETEKGGQKPETMTYIQRDIQRELQRDGVGTTE